MSQYSNNDMPASHALVTDSTRYSHVFTTDTFHSIHTLGYSCMHTRSQLALVSCPNEVQWAEQQCSEASLLWTPWDMPSVLITEVQFCTHCYVYL